MSRYRATTTVLLVLVALAACSGADLVVEIDLQDFVTESGTLADPSADYAVPVIAVPVELTGIELLAPTSIAQVEAIDDLSTIRAVRLDYALQSVHRRGEATATVRLRMAGTLEGLASASAVLDSVDLVLVPGTDEIVTRTVELPDAFVALFRGAELWLGADFDVRVESATAIGDSLAGRIWLRDATARVLADSDFF